jgi:hypothetical protein
MLPTLACCLVRRYKFKLAEYPLFRIYGPVKVAKEQLSELKMNTGDNFHAFGWSIKNLARNDFLHPPPFFPSPTPFVNSLIAKMQGSLRVSLSG